MKHMVLPTALLLSGFAGTVGAYTQAPMLERLVKEGRLVDVDRRLPERPEVIKPLTRVGVYGGTLRSGLRGPGDQHGVMRLIGNQGLVRWNYDFSAVVPNLAERWEISSDATEFTFHLRKGTRWSDGNPLTAEDIVFSMNDLVANKQFYPATPSMFVIKDKTPTVTAVNAETVRFKFPAPYISFLSQLATPVAQHPTMWQKKYCSQFHPNYNLQVSDLAAREKQKDWTGLMRLKCADIEVRTRYANPDRPTLEPWVIREPYLDASKRVVLERNPYFWQVDTKGQQLPYIDRIEMKVHAEVEDLLFDVVTGAVDFQHRHTSGIQNRPVLQENQGKGRYKAFDSVNVNANSAGLWLNQSTLNPKLRALMRQLPFRQALSYAINRSDVNDLVFVGQGTPWQSGPLPQSQFYNAKLATQYTAFDIKQANALLDGLGLKARDAQGFRQYPDGGRVEIVAISQASQQTMNDVLDVVRNHWRAVGISLVINPLERGPFFDRAEKSQYDLSIDVIPGGLDATLNPRAFVTMHPQESRQSTLWAKWYLSDGKLGEEPSPGMKRRLQLYDQWLAARSQAEADGLFKQILQLAADEFEVIGTVRPPVDTGIYRDSLVNVYDKMPSGWTYPTPAPVLLQQWFYGK
ncbi:MAG: ABC transporter substrate-binding protein [Moraxellaceae bacterium]|nr:ABC transporter substrate-binding protein [Moraxellaceae bacterium]